MKFYEFNAKSCFELTTPESADRTANVQYRRVFDENFQSSNKETYVFVSSMNRDELSGAVITSALSASEDYIEKVLGACDITLVNDSVKLRECDSSVFGVHLQDAYALRLIPRPDDLLEAFSPLNEIFDIRNAGILRRAKFYSEKIATPKQKADLTEEAGKILWAPSLTDELERVYLKPAVEVARGIPVHYIFAGNDFYKRGEAIEILISALYENGRIKQKRYADISVSAMDERDADCLGALFEAYEGGSIVFRFRNEARREVSSANVSLDVIEAICSCIFMYSESVQIILAFPLACEKEKELFFERLGGLSFVLLYEGIADKAGAVKYLLREAEKCDYTNPAGLSELISEDRPYRAVELDKIYSEWSSNYLKNTVYPQYANVRSVENAVLGESAKGNAYEKLQKMIGLKSAKEVIDDAINYAKAQKLLSARGLKTGKPSMHMVFTGNPGTAKTTVARLFAEIMRDNKVLSSGHMIEVGRGDLVGRYVGWTAQTVQKKFREAKGGVLFIDEAYSLVDSNEGSYGDEAINTIVQEMENNRSDVIVIFAGYPDETETFLERNPGLRSRIAFHVNFEDYTPDELIDITELMAREKELKLDTGVTEKLLGIYKNAAKNTDFGNGRFVRNLIEKASMRQASRLVSGDFDTISNDTLTTLSADDFVYEESKKECAKIGFVI